MKKELITYIYILLILLVPVSTIAQEANKVRIYGKITDAATKEVLPYASIRINKTSIGCSSDNRGNFSFYAPTLRDTLNHIQKEEQNHGEQLYEYMSKNNMYC